MKRITVGMLSQLFAFIVVSTGCGTPDILDDNSVPLQQAINIDSIDKETAIVEPNPILEPTSRTTEGLGEASTWSGKCCRYSCKNGRAYYSTEPTYGNCTDWARFACDRYNSSSYIEGSAHWGKCG